MNNSRFSSQNLYINRTNKSGNEESGIFGINGRINRKAFFLRWLFTVYFYVVSAIIYWNGFFLSEHESRLFVFLETVHLYILPFFILIFNLVQGVKRLHDVNKSGLYLLVPFYNIYLFFNPGTIGTNNYGIDPSPSKDVQFFDEIDTTIKKSE
jgi:uncharacterized membrane protein YhaH (DUF805 family)